jgi:hypothetical protein
VLKENDGFLQNSPGVIVTLGNPPGKGKARKRTMAKRRISKKQRAAALRNLKKARAARRGGSRRRRSSPPVVVHRRAYRTRGGRRRVSRRSVTVSARRNAPMLGGWFNIPTGGEVVAVGVAALALPTVTRYVTNLIPVAALQGNSYGNILAEFGVAALASGAARKMGFARIGDAVLLLGTARAVGRVAFKVTSGNIGFAEDGAEAVPQLGAYADRVPELGAYSDRQPDMGENDFSAESLVDGSGAY